MKKTVLVTGGAGFIGHHFIKRILLEGYRVVCLDRLDFSGNLNRLAEIMHELPPIVASNLQVIYHDLRAEINPQLAKQIGCVDYIVHMAAGSHVDRSIQNPIQFVQDNVVGTCNLLEYARLYLPNLEKFIYFGTDEIFGSAPYGVDFKEYDRYNSRSPYSATKAAAEELCVAYENTYNMPIYCTHVMNTYGVRQNPEKFIGLVINKLLNDEPVMIHGDDTGTISGLRTWIHVDDVVDATLFIMNLPHGEFPLADNSTGITCPKFNITSNEELSNLMVAQMIAEVVGKELSYDIVDNDSQRPGHDFRYSLSGTYLASLGWKPKFTFQERIKAVVEWTIANQHWLL
jgi:dTDP-glucose 4,6-dehydratase